MKTINGDTPQLEPDVMQEFYRKPFSEDKVTTDVFINKQLQEWSNARRCVRCYYLEDFNHVFGPGQTQPMKRCSFINIIIGLTKHCQPETFSCAAFEEKK